MGSYNTSEKPWRDGFLAIFHWMGVGRKTQEGKEIQQIYWYSDRITSRQQGANMDACKVLGIQKLSFTSSLQKPTEIASENMD